MWICIGVMHLSCWTNCRAWIVSLPLFLTLLVLTSVSIFFKSFSRTSLYRLELWGAPYILNNLINFKLFHLYFYDFFLRKQKKRGTVSNMISHIYNMFLYVTPKKQKNSNPLILCSYILSWTLKYNWVCLNAFWWNFVNPHYEREATLFNQLNCLKQRNF